ncbi:MAG: hypothetical protein MUD14_09810 [Hydrococcus sp. Prado102]|nr:hypothetical protein [Hydrococcus sp. Prado102]
MTQLKQFSPSKLIGAGRSGKVFLVEKQQGLLARKIFYKDKLASLIHYFFFGAPNAYIWNENAIYCAFYRRKILSALVQFWFGDRLKVADAIAIEWNEEFKAYQFDTEFIQGKHVALRQPCNRERNSELSVLVREIMLPLQKRLLEAGLDGLIWQAGKGVPNALNNFLLVNDTPGQYRFVWIDLESGVPALFPLNPFTLFSFYLPKSFKYKRALFDDINPIRLRRYVNHHKVKLKECLGSQQYNELLEDISQLEDRQEKWKLMRRSDRSIQYHFKKGEIDEQQANWYAEHTLFWHGIELLGVLVKLAQKLVIELPVWLVKKLLSIPYLHNLKQFWKFISSQRYRLSLARNYVLENINRWQDRKHLKQEETNNLLQHLERESSSDYLNDFGVHLGIKMFFMVIELVFVPLLYLVSFIDEFIVVTWLIAGGPIYRTVYTLWRMLQNASNRKEIPWIAFLVGFIPTFGVLAYPCQIIFSAQGKKKKIAKFIVYDFFSKIGAKIPIWGGEDTQTEHFFNRFADKLVYRRGNQLVR